MVVKNKSDTTGKKIKVDNSAIQERTVLVKDAEADTTVEAKIFELLDLFMRDSSLGVYQSRLIFVDFLKAHLTFKLEHQTYKQPEFVKVRL